MRESDPCRQFTCHLDTLDPSPANPMMSPLIGDHDYGREWDRLAIGHLIIKIAKGETPLDLLTHWGGICYRRKQNLITKITQIQDQLLRIYDDVRSWNTNERVHCPSCIASGHRDNVFRDCIAITDCFICGTELWDQHFDLYGPPVIPLENYLEINPSEN